MNSINKMLIIIALIFLSTKLAAQENDSIDQCQFIAVYDYVIHTTDAADTPVNDSVQMAVLVGKHSTKYIEFNRVMSHDFGEWENIDYQMGEWNARKYNLPVIYMNHPKGEMRSFDKIVPHRFLVTDKIPTIDWVLSDETQIIGGYMGHKATGKYAGRTWTAWYTEEIPSSAGPWKLRGLPGLILQANDIGNIFSFSINQIIKRSGPIIYMSEMEHQKISSSKFTAKRNKLFCNKRYIQNPRYYIPDGALEGSVEMWPGGPKPPMEERLTTIAYDLIVPKKVNVYQPLELE